MQRNAIQISMISTIHIWWSTLGPRRRSRRLRKDGFVSNEAWIRTLSWSGAVIEYSLWVFLGWNVRFATQKKALLDVICLTSITMRAVFVLLMELVDVVETIINHPPVMGGLWHCLKPAIKIHAVNHSAPPGSQRFLSSSRQLWRRTDQQLAGYWKRYENLAAGAVGAGMMHCLLLIITYVYICLHMCLHMSIYDYIWLFMILYDCICLYMIGILQ